MKPKKLYRPEEYIKLLEFCLFVTNIGEQAESIIRSIYRRYICNDNISARQYSALHNISVTCADSTFNQKILKTISLKFVEPSEGLPVFAMGENDTLRIVSKIPLTEEITNDWNSNSMYNTSDFTDSDDKTIDSGKTDVPTFSKEIEDNGIKLDGSTN